MSMDVCMNEQRKTLQSQHMISHLHVQALNASLMIVIMIMIKVPTSEAGCCPQAARERFA